MDLTLLDSRLIQTDDILRLHKIHGISLECCESIADAGALDRYKIATEGWKHLRAKGLKDRRFLYRETHI
jgi:hypothetical protein